MVLNESAEMYLETIYTLSMAKANVRSIDVAEALGYSTQRQPRGGPAEKRRLSSDG